ncbi:MAG: ArsC family (seleno)protein [Bdellovibrionota bacterium]
MTCKRAEEFLSQEKIPVTTQVDAKKERIGAKDAVKLARSAGELWVAKGKKFLHFNLKKDKLTDAELEKVLLGPSGNLRAPTLRKGNELFVGFHPEAFKPRLLQ